MRFLILLLLLASLSTAPPAVAADDLHADLDLLLGRYVTEDGVRYAAWADNPDDLRLLSDYIDRLESASPGGLTPPEALAFWINLYNAATLELVLAHYPVDSIKQTAGFLRSPWNRKLVTVEGTELSLNAIEHDIIRARFDDARIHFALNCASKGCPPLADHAFEGDALEDQLDEVCRRALRDPEWVLVEDDRLVLTKIFDWYRDDFEHEAGSLEAFIAPYREDGDGLVRDAGTRKIVFADYDWSLNESR